MSFNGMLRHRATVKRLTESNRGGMPVHMWVKQKEQVPCFLDLNFIRRGRDPQWTPEAGRPSARQGVSFWRADAPIRNGDRIEMTRGPSGTYTLDMSVDEAATPRGAHHLEAFVLEVPSQIEKGSK